MNRDWGLDIEGRIAEFINNSSILVGRESRGRIVGVGALAASPPQPLLLVNERRIDHPRTPSFRWPDSGFSVYPWSREIAEQIGAYIDAPDDTVILVGEPPEPMGSRNPVPPESGIAIRARMRGTLGPQINSPTGVRHLTAGHVAGPVGTDVRRIAKRLVRPTIYPRIGRVEHSDEAAFGRPGYDVGVVICERCMGRASRSAHLSQYQSASLPGTLIGGVSGKGFGLIIGSLATHTDVDGRHLWANSWIMTPGSIGAEGDSGGSVQLDGGEVLGILVGGSRVEGSRDFAHLYVQDLESIERDFLAVENRL